MWDLQIMPQSYVVCLQVRYRLFHQQNAKGTSDLSTQRGRAAESLAAELLRVKGYTIVTRNYRAGRADGGGEIDLVALEGDLYVFVEVKSRLAGGGVFAVDAAKAERVARAAAAFLREAGVSPEVVRFDIVEVEGSGGVTHHIDAWRS